MPEYLFGRCTAPRHSKELVGIYDTILMYFSPVSFLVSQSLEAISFHAARWSLDMPNSIPYLNRTCILEWCRVTNILLIPIS